MTTFVAALRRAHCLGRIGRRGARLPFLSPALRDRAEPWGRATAAWKRAAVTRHFASAAINGSNGETEALLPPQSAADEGKLTVVLDMDETLIHSIFAGESDGKGQYRQQELRRRASRLQQHDELQSFSVVLPGGETEVTVKTNKRPHLDRFLARLKERCELVIFTAAVPQYANCVLDVLDPHAHFFAHRLYRGACTNRNGYYLKDLNVLGRDIRRTVLVDNNNLCFLPQPANGIPIGNFFDDVHDNELLRVADLIEGELCELADVRGALNQRFDLERQLAVCRELIYSSDVEAEEAE